MSYVLFTAIGDTDPVRGQFDGPMLHIVRHYKPSKVYMFLTADMSKREKDTGCYEKAIKFLSPECEIEKIFTDIDNAHSFDEFAIRFDSIINEIHNENPDSQILLNISSATPQIKTSMCLAVISHRHNLIPVQVCSPENKTNKFVPHFDPYKDDLMYELENLLDNLDDAENRCSVSDIISFKRSMVKNRIKSLISNYDYKGAYNLLYENRELLSLQVGQALEHALYRSKLDYSNAEKTAKDIGKYELLYPISEVKVKKACEYYLIMKIKQHQGELTDFILRLSPIADYLAEDFLERNGIRIERIADTYKNDGWKISRSKANKNYPGLMEYLDSFYGNTGYRAEFVNLRTLLKVIEYLLPNEKEAIEIFTKWQNIMDIRNDLAHNLDTVKDDDLKKRYNTNSDRVCQDIEKVLRIIYKESLKPKIFTIYDIINQMIFEAMDS